MYLGRSLTFLLISYSLLGFGLKYIDAAFDEESVDRKIALLISPFLGLLWVYIMVIDPFSAVILSAIILGVLIGGKIDNPAHSIGLFTIIFLVIVSGLKVMFLPLVLLTVSAYLDEVGNDIVDSRKREDRFLDVFIRYFFGRRWLLKIAVLYMVLIDVFPMYSMVAVILFDESYLLMSEYSRSRLKR